MDALQNQTNPEKPKAEESNPVGQLSFAQDQYISFVACGGLIPDADGDATAVKMTATLFAQKVGVARQTLYEWRESIPNFWDLVASRRKELGGKDRLIRVWNGVFLKAASGNAEAAKLYLANFDPDFRMPMQKVEHEAGDTLMEALSLARQRNPQLIEGEIIREPDSRAQ